MNLMAWSDHFVTGIDAIDAQHRALVDMINEAAPQLATGGEEAMRTLGPLLDKLTHYAATHFKFEERLMQELHLEPAYYAQHVQTHAAFVEEVVQMRQQFESDADLSGSDLLHFLTSWLTFHILSEDKRMAHQIVAVRQGATPENAYAALDAPEGAPQAVYTAALIDLFGLLTQRNRTLADANAQILLAKQDLELRVQERTQDLRETITQLERTQQQLLQSEKMAAVGQLAAGVAHEINNPLGFVNSNMATLSQYIAQLFKLIGAYEKVVAAAPPSVVSTLQSVRNEVDMDYLREDVPALLKESKEGLARVKRIVSDLRDFSHEDDAGWGSSNIEDALEYALNMAANEIKYKADVVKEFGAVGSIVCKVQQLHQVFINLLVNAANAITGRGVITVRAGALADPGDDRVWIEISDTGVGMTEEIRKRIFEPFFTTKPVGKGTGLGLSISWEIIQRHHGTIAAQSTPGVGSTFRIELPARQ
jgi:hemerythrin-like metal-binding protein